MRLFKVILAIIVTLIFVAILLSQIPFKSKISIQSHAALFINHDQSFFDTTDFQIIGTYKHRLLGADEFEGRFIIDGYSYTSDDSIIWLRSDIDVGMSMNYVKLNKNGDMDIEYLGIIFFEKEFSSFTIFIFESESPDSPSIAWNKETGLILSYPAFDRQAALTVTKDLTKHSETYKSVTWE